MRQVREYVAKDGTKTHRVRYRLDGTEHSQTFRSKKDADTFAKMVDVGVIDALRWLADRAAGTPDGPTFAQFFETYVDQLTGVTIRTRDDYRAQKRRYLTELDPLPLPLITRGHVTSIVNRLEREGRSPKTIRNALHMLSSCMGLAVDEGLIGQNPCRRIRLPKPAPKDDTKFLTQAEFLAILEATPEHYRPLVLTLGGTGMRWSEATALQGQHLKGNAVTVSQAWKRVPGGWENGAPKSEKSNRTIILPVTVVEALEPIETKRGQFIFRTPAGHPVRHANFYNRVWQPACRAAGMVPPPGIHALRHSHCAWLIARGTSLPVIQARLGHEKITTTIDTYGHLVPDLQVAAAQAAEHVFGNLRELA